eukprot:GDKI01038439.1.p1 GENE.GDKI01038439.1~~GDKI01038439.1.p1  ORF type:complete len:103 (+),score=20.22 GDKI01038439.1:208-516(+)
MHKNRSCFAQMPVGRYVSSLHVNSRTHTRKRAHTPHGRAGFGFAVRIKLMHIASTYRHIPACTHTYTGIETLGHWHTHSWTNLQARAHTRGSHYTHTRARAL